MRPSFLFALPVGVTLLAACSATDLPSDPAPVTLGRTAGAIINGQLDTTHQAVVALILQAGTQGGLCSGTIIKTDPVAHVGWVLTAGHCVEIPPVYVLQGDDFSQPGVLRYDVIDYQADSRYDGTPGSPYDFAVVRIAGVDATTPTIPTVSLSGGSVSVGTKVLSVGYGRTTLIATGAGTENTIRRRVAKTLSQVSQQQIAYDMQSDGICQGDSGGPVLVTIGGVEQVAGVHSYVEGDCNGTGVSCRVSFEASFVSGELAKGVPPDSCDLCGQIAESGNGACAAATRSCLADPACKGYWECLSAGSTDATCVARFPKAEGPFNAAANCQCTKACVTQCKGTYACTHTPKCGYKLPAGACATCTEGACCDEALACSADGTCYVCLKTNDAAPECATNAARKKMATCVASKCSAECAGSGLATGADPLPADPVPGDGAAAPPTTTTTTTTGCAVAATGHERGGSGALLAGVAALALAARVRRRRTTDVRGVR